MMRIALVGAGRVALTHARVLKRIPGIKIVAVADPRKEASEDLARMTGAESFASLEEVLKFTDCDAVDLMVPHFLHHPLAMLALESGLDVFMDKPIASNIEQGMELCLTADRLNRTLAVCHNLIFHPAMTYAQSKLSTGMLGRITRAEAWSSGWLELTEGDFRKSRTATGGGAWVDGAAHLIYSLEALMGPIASIHAIVPSGPSRLGGEDTAIGIANFERGPVATLAVGYSDCPPSLTTDWPDGWQLGLKVLGTHGRIEVDFLPIARVRTQSFGDESSVKSFNSDSFDAGFEGALRSFFEKAEHGTALSVTPWDSLQNLKLVRDSFPVG